jgi:predicted TIM-barrel fold metal-dependent hydrolase
MSEYRIISSDSHVIEPEDLWEKRIDKPFRDRAPRLFHEGDTDQWICDGMRFGVIGGNQQAGLRFEDPAKLTMEGSMATVRLGGLDPTAHVNDMDLDGIAAGVLYPSQGLTLFGIPATDVLSASFRAYNDYLAEFCSPYPDRLKGIAMVNVDDMEEGTEELERAAKIGLAGAMISIDPVLPYHHAAYDRFWAAAQDLNLPLSLHTGTMRWKPGMNTAAITLETGFGFSNREYNPRECIDHILFSGVFERFPKLKVGVIEFEIAWAPYFINQMDDYYKQRPTGVQLPRFKNDMLPSDFFRSNVFIGFQEDELGIQLRHHIGVNTLLWGSDYPHAESTFPKSREILGQILSGVPEEEQAKIAGENTAKLYGFD